MCFFTPKKGKEKPFNNSNIKKTIEILIEIQTQNLTEFLPKHQKSKVQLNKCLKQNCNF